MLSPYYVANDNACGLIAQLVSTLITVTPAFVAPLPVADWGRMVNPAVGKLAVAVFQLVVALAPVANWNPMASPDSL